MVFPKNVTQLLFDQDAADVGADTKAEGTGHMQKSERIEPGATSAGGLTAAADGRPIDERRSGGRVHTIYRTGLLSAGRGNGLCRIGNISNAGMMLVTSVTVEPGSTVQLSLSDTVSLSGEVIWIDGPRVGVRFLAPIDAAGVLQRLAAEHRLGEYRSPRLPVSAIGVATTERGFHSVRIRNISQFGMQISHKGSLAAGMAVKIVLSNGLEGRGTVRWAKGGLAGVRLREPFPVDHLAWESEVSSCGVS